MKTKMHSVRHARKRPAEMNNCRKLVSILILAMLIAVVTMPNSYGEEKLGKISGQIINKENSQSLLGATISVQGTALGAITDLDGNFRINKVPVGTYSLMATSVGFAPVLISEITVIEGTVTTVNFIMEPKVMEMEGVKVEATVNKNTQAILLHQRRNAAVVSDGISSQEISRAASGDAAEAMTKVTGASVVDGKFVFVRGLGDRYSNTQLNGSTMASPDPDKQAVALDMFPSGLLDNIIIEKSFTPDKPGDFTGGSVNINTKDYPETKSLVFSTSTGTNSITRAGEELLAQDHSSKDWLGFDSGHRGIPQIVLDHPNDMLGQKGTSFEISGTGLADSAYLVDYYEDASQAFNPEMTGKKREIPLNQNHSLSYGNLHSIFGNPLGMVASLSYSKKYNSYDGIYGSYERTSNTTVLQPKYTFDNTWGKEEVLWGGLINLKYGFHPSHKIGWNLVHTRNGESEARYMFGEWPEFVEEGSYARNNVLSYTERKVTANQFSGSHALFDNKIRADWQIALDRTSQENPDVRFFTDQVSYSETVDSITGRPVDTLYQIVTSRFSKPKRLWREIEVDKNEYQANVTIPISTHTKFKHGFAIQNTHRDVWERRFEYLNNLSYPGFNGDIQAYIEDVGLDTVTTREVGGITRYRYSYTNVLKEFSEPNNSYTGDKEIFATYCMIEMPLVLNLHFVGGVRYEETEMHTISSKGALLGKGISEQDLLPSVNIIYRMGDRMNFRTSFSRTLARPSLLEISASHIETFNDGDIYSGNPNLQMSKARNYDLRWEWFLNPGEIIAVSFFYKKIYDPIEEVILHPVHFEIQPQNSEDAELRGFELEYRRRLGFISNTLRNFRLGGNYTYVKSEVKLTDAELLPVRTFDPDFPDTRPLWGQSPYMVNVDFGFDSYATGTSLSLFYNVIGKRLKYNSQGATPDVYEEPRNLLDFTLSQKVLLGSTFKFAVKNILNEDEKIVYDDLNGTVTEEYIHDQRKMGVSYTFGVSYQVW